MEKKISDLKNLCDIQSESGNWNCNPYMQGLTNGLIMALSIFTGEEPKFKSAPDKWLDDIAYSPSFTDKADGDGGEEGVSVESHAKTTPN